MSRLAPQPGEVIDRGRPVKFRFDGKTVDGFDGDSIASALYAAGVRVFSHSGKYQRRRGLMCGAGQCPNCLVEVDGKPGVLSCVQPVRDGIEVRSRGHLAALDVNPPRALWPLYRRVRRHVAAGALPVPPDARTGADDGASVPLIAPGPLVQVDVLVVGGGVAGMSAALAAAGQGAEVTLVEERPWLGGRLLWEGGHEQARSLAAQFERAGVRVCLDTTAVAHAEGAVLVSGGEQGRRIAARQFIYATGAIEQPLVFAGNDLPGVMLSGGARRLLALYATAPGSRAVVATSSDRGVRAAIALKAAGVPVAVVADLRPDPTRACRRLPANRIEVLQGWTVVEARGQRSVRSAVLAPIERLRSGSAHLEVECDLLIAAGSDAPALAPLIQAGARTRYDQARGYFRIDRLPAGVLAAGQVVGEGGWGVAEVSGELAGLEAVHALGLANSHAAGVRARLRERLAANDRPERAVPPSDAGEGAPGGSFVCFCTDVSSKDIRRCGAHGGENPFEACRQATSVTMGPCQGQMCHLATLRLIAKETGVSMDELGASGGAGTPARS
jgi:sarcosine oxidase subunit alpha